MSVRLVPLSTLSRDVRHEMRDNEASQIRDKRWEINQSATSTMDLRVVKPQERCELTRMLVSNPYFLQTTIVHTILPLTINLQYRENLLKILKIVRATDLKHAHASAFCNIQIAMPETGQSASSLLADISDSIEAITDAIEMCSTTKKSFPEQAQKVAEQLPSIQTLLREAEGSKNEKDAIWISVGPDVQKVKTSCVDLRTFFAKALSDTKLVVSSKIDTKISVGEHNRAMGSLSQIYNGFKGLLALHIISNAELLNGIGVVVEGQSGSSNKTSGNRWEMALRGWLQDLLLSH